MNLNEFIFLTEGLLRIPPVLSQQVKDFGYQDYQPVETSHSKE